MENQVFLKNKAHIKYILVITKMNNILKDFSSNFSSSIVVLLVAIPLCLGIALASGAPYANSQTYCSILINFNVFGEKLAGDLIITLTIFNLI